MELHDFFAAWFRGDVPNDDHSFARFADAMHADFSMVMSATGGVIGRTEVLSHVRRAHGSTDPTTPFRIEIRDLEARAVCPHSALVSYEEWQFDGDRLRSARTSTACLVTDAAAPMGVAWRHLHETLHPADGRA